MEYTITPSSDGLFIILKVKGDITRGGALKMNLEAHSLGRRLRISRYLVDATEARNVEMPSGNYQFAYSDMQNKEVIDQDAVVATVVSPDDHSHDFVETVARNAGLYMRLFTDFLEAKRFLMAHDSAPEADAGHIRV